MNWLPSFLFRRQIDRDLADEIRGHLEERAAELERTGLSRSEALIQARRAFGNPVLIEENGRGVWRVRWMEDLAADLVYALRQLRRAPSYTTAAVLTLALGIGANTAVFSVVNGVLLRPLPFRDSDRLVEVQCQDMRGTPHSASVSYPNFFDFRKQNQVFESMASYQGSDGSLMVGDTAVHMNGQIVAWQFFAVLGVNPVLGRGFLPGEEAAGQHAVMISQKLWQDRFQSDPAIAGRSIVIDRQPYTVVGVVPLGFRYPVGGSPNDFWMTPAVMRSGNTVEPVTEQRGARMLNVVGRLKSGVALAQAKAQLDSVAANLARVYPDSNRNIPAVYVWSSLERTVGDSRRALAVLLIVVTLVMLIACANLANLLLARTADRTREFAIRMAIGAGRGRVIRQMLTENLVLAVLGCLVGISVAYVSIHQGAPLFKDGIPRMENVSLDARVLCYSILLAISTGVLFSLPAVFELRKFAAAGTSRQGTRSVTETNEGLRGTLVVAQIAVGLMLLCGAALLTSEFAGILRRDLGFRTDHLAKFNVSVPEDAWGEAGQVQFAERLLDRLRATPGVTSAAMVAPPPLGDDDISISFSIPDRPSAPSERPSSNMAFVTPGYFETLGTPILAGRDFTANDDSEHPSVVIINQAFADKYFPGENPVGKRLEPGATSRRTKGKIRQIVGVVGNARQEALGRAVEPIYYLAFKQLTWFLPSIVVRTETPVAGIEPTLRQVVASIDKSVPLHDFRTFESMFASAVAMPRMSVVLVGGFAFIALALTVVGLYGVLAYSVSRRTREFGVRMALGANRDRIVGLVMRRALLLVAIGIPLGLVGAMVGQRLIEKILYGVGNHSPWLLVGACLVVALAALTAAYLPARRAASTDPMTALRAE